MNIKPMDQYVLIRPDKPPSHGPKGLLILPDIARHPIWQGIVLAKGDGFWCTGNGDQEPFRIPIDVEVGDRVFYGEQYAGIDFKVDGEKLFLCPCSELMAVMEA